MPRKYPLEEVVLHEEVVYRPNPNRVHPPIDKKVQKRHNAQAARRTKRAKAEAAKGEFPFTDTAMNEALARVEANMRTPADARVIAMMRRFIEGRRRGAQKPRKPSEAVTLRIAATLQAFSKLTPKLQKHHLGEQTVSQLIDAVEAQGHRTNEATLAKDLAKVRDLIGPIRQRKAPPPRIKPVPEGQTLLEQEAGRRAVALAEARMALIGMIQRRFLGN